MGSVVLADAIRVSHARVLVPVVTLTRRKREVVLIGMVHLAEEKFFDGVNKRLAACERSGFRILYEGMDDTLDPSQFSSEAMRSLRKLNFKVAIFKKAIKEMGLRYQTDCVVPKPTWMSADLTTSEYRKEKEQRRGLHPEKVRPVSVGKFTEDPKKTVYVMLEVFSNLPEKKESNELGVDRRNMVAVATIDQYITHASVATYWGALHLPGITELLLQDGWRLQKKEWNIAFNLAKLRAKIG